MKKYIFFFKDADTIKEYCFRNNYAYGFIYDMVKLVRNNMNKPHIFIDYSRERNLYSGPIDLEVSYIWHIDWLTMTDENGQFYLNFGK